MARTESSWIVLLFAFITTIPDETMANANLSQVSPLREKCQNVYNSNNFYAGPNKKVETLLHEVKKELKEIQKDISPLKGNRTSVEGKYQIANHGCISIFKKIICKIWVDFYSLFLQRSPITKVSLLFWYEKQVFSI